MHAKLIKITKSKLKRKPVAYWTNLLALIQNFCQARAEKNNNKKKIIHNLHSLVP